MGKEIKINRHKMIKISGEEITFKRTANIGGKLEPKYLVMHYTAGTTLDGAVTWLTNKGNGASAHIVIDREGEVVQLAGFDQVTFHAGASFWEGFRGMNQHSIGIELVNAGLLKWNGKQWIDWVRRPVEEDDMIKAVHKFGTQEYGWQSYPEAQIEQAVTIGRALVEKYGLVDVIGHEDISPRRKWDPGPAFPMDSFRSRVMGRRVETPVTLNTRGTLTLRRDPNSAGEKTSKKPMPSGTVVEQLDRQLEWTQVILANKHDGEDGLIGWLPTRHLARLFDEGVQ